MTAGQTGRRFRRCWGGGCRCFSFLGLLFDRQRFGRGLGLRAVEARGDQLVVSMARALPNTPGAIAFLKGGKVRWQQDNFGAATLTLVGSDLHNTDAAAAMLLTRNGATWTSQGLTLATPRAIQQANVALSGNGATMNDGVGESSTRRSGTSHEPPSTSYTTRPSRPAAGSRLVEHAAPLGVEFVEAGVVELR